MRLYYTLPHASPDQWHPSYDQDSTVQLASIQIPALDETEQSFRWRPQRTDIPEAPEDTQHFCLLATIDHPYDALAFSAGPAEAGPDAWTTNITSTNNIALRNIHIIGAE